MPLPHLLRCEEGQGWQCPEALLLAIGKALIAGQVHRIHVGDRATCHREGMAARGTDSGSKLELAPLDLSTQKN